MWIWLLHYYYWNNDEVECQLAWRDHSNSWIQLIIWMIYWRQFIFNECIDIWVSATINVSSQFSACRIRVMIWSCIRSSHNGKYLILCCIRPKYHMSEEFNLCWCSYSQSSPVRLIHFRDDGLLRHQHKLSNGEFGGNAVLHSIARWAERDSEIQWLILMVILMQ